MEQLILVELAFNFSAPAERCLQDFPLVITFLLSLEGCSFAFFPDGIPDSLSWRWCRLMSTYRRRHPPRPVFLVALLSSPWPQCHMDGLLPDPCIGCIGRVSLGGLQFPPGCVAIFWNYPSPPAWIMCPVSAFVLGLMGKSLNPPSPLRLLFTA